MTNEELLNEARIRYPVGTIFKAARGFGREYTVKNLKDFYWRDVNNICTETEGNGTIYSKESGTWKWAEIVSKPEVKEESKFIVGKWYRNYSWSSFICLKFEKEENGCYYGEKLYGSGNIIYCTKDYINHRDVIEGLESLKDPSEIQQYLPDGHVDKFPVKQDAMKELTELPEKWFIKTTDACNTIVCDWFDKTNGSKTDRTIGNFYCSNSGSLNGWMHYARHNVNGYTEITFDQFKKWVLKESNSITISGETLGLMNESIYSCLYGSEKKPYLFKYNGTHITDTLQTKDKIFNKSSWKFWENSISLRKATDEEKQWLERCIAADKFISLEDSKKSDVPEYVICIKKDSGIEIGNVYKPSRTGSVIDGKYIFYINGRAYYRSYFKPSTKESYDAQFVKTEEKTDMQAILEEAKRRYPVGTKFMDTLDTHCVKRELQIENEGISHWGIGYVYFRGQWADIVQPAKEESVSENKTVREWFNTLPPHLRDKAIYNCNTYGLYVSLKDVCPDLQSAIQEGFSWSSTPEGFPFWDDLYDLIEEYKDISTYGLGVKDQITYEELRPNTWFDHYFIGIDSRFAPTTTEPTTKIKRLGTTTI